MILTDLEIQKINNDLIDWLPFVTPKEIDEYSRTVFQKNPELAEELNYTLPSTIKQKICNDLLYTYSCNAPIILSGIKIIELIINFSLYNPVSVLVNYQKKFPEFRAENINVEMVKWAQDSLTLWYNCFYLLSWQSYVSSALYTQSIYDLKFNITQLKQLIEESKIIGAMIVKEIHKNNGNNDNLSPELLKQCLDFFSNFTFLPIEFNEKLKLYPSISSIFSTFKYFSYALDVVESLNQNTQLEKEELDLIVWDSLRINKMTLYWKENTLKETVVGDVSAIKSIIKFLNKISSYDFLMNGTTGTKVCEYFNTLNPAQKEWFSDILRNYFSNSILYISIVEGVDLKFFYQKIKECASKSDQVEFINSLDQYIDPILWPVARKTFLLMAEYA